MAHITLKSSPSSHPARAPRARKERKAGEKRASGSFVARGIAFFKFPDRSVCPNCGMLQPKPEEQPDFMAALDWFYVEVKESDAQGYFRFASPETGLRPAQRKRLEQHEGYIYLVMREPGGTPPDGESAYLIPYGAYLTHEFGALKAGHKSWRRTATRVLASTDDLFAPWRLRWCPQRGTAAGHWELPEGSWRRS